MQVTIDAAIATIEAVLAKPHLDDHDLDSARRALRERLAERIDDPRRGQTLGDVVASLTEDGRPFSTEAAYLIRYLTVQDLLPENNATNNLHRNICTLTQRSLPAVWSFFKLDDKKQTFEKIEVLINAFAHIRSLLEPLASAPGELSALLNSKQLITHGMNHGSVRAYCNPFGLAELKGIIDTCFSRLSRLNIDSETLAVDVREAQTAIEEGHQFCKVNSTFLTRDFGHILFRRAEGALINFVSAARGRLTSVITPLLMPQDYLQKRYPFHEEGRVVQLLIPLKNQGPGRAIGLAAQISSNAELLFEKEEILLGNIPPGPFVVAAKAMVITPVSETILMVSLTWTEIGSAEWHHPRLYLPALRPRQP